jgi:hypothetical protein
MIKNFGNVLDVKLKFGKNQRYNFLNDIKDLRRNLGLEEDFNAFEFIQGDLNSLTPEQLSILIRETARSSNAMSWRTINLERSSRLDLPLIRSTMPSTGFGEGDVKGGADAPVRGVLEGDYAVLSALDFSPDGSNIGSLWESMMTMRAFINNDGTFEANPVTAPLFAEPQTEFSRNYNRASNALFSLHEKSSIVYNFFNRPILFSNEIGGVTSLVEEDLQIDEPNLNESVDQFLKDRAIIPTLRKNEEINFTNVFFGLNDALNLFCSWGAPENLNLNCYAAADPSQNIILDNFQVKLTKNSQLMFPNNLETLNKFRKEDNKPAEQNEDILQNTINEILASIANQGSEEGKSNAPFSPDNVLAQFSSTENNYRTSSVFVEMLKTAKLFKIFRDKAFADEIVTDRSRLNLESLSLLIRRMLSFWLTIARNSALHTKDKRKRIPTELRSKLDSNDFEKGFIDELLGEPLGLLNANQTQFDLNRLIQVKDETPESSLRSLFFVDAYDKLFLPFNGGEQANDFLRRVVSDKDIKFTVGSEWLKKVDKTGRQNLNFISALSTTIDPYDCLEPFSTVVSEHITNVAVAASQLSNQKLALTETVEDEQEAERRFARNAAIIDTWETPEVLRARIEERLARRKEILDDFIQFWTQNFVSEPGTRTPNLGTNVALPGLRPEFAVLSDFTENGAISVSTKQVNLRRIQDRLVSYWFKELGGNIFWAVENFKFVGGFASPPLPTGTVQTTPTPNNNSTGSFQPQGTTFSSNTSGPNVNRNNTNAAVGTGFTREQNVFIGRVKDLFKKYEELARFDDILEYEENLLEQDLIKAEEKLPELENLVQLQQTLIEQVEDIRRLRSEREETIASSQTTIISHQMLIEAFKEIETNKFNLFTSLSSLTFAKWLNVDSRLPNRFGFETDKTISQAIEGEIRRTAQGLTVTQFNNQIKNNSPTNTNVMFTPFSSGFIVGTSEVKPIEYIALNLIGPVFEKLFEYDVFDSGDKFVAGTTRWLGMDQTFLWSLALFIVAAELKYVQLRTNEKLGKSTRTANVEFVREFGTGTQNRLAMKFIPNDIYSLLTSKKEMEVSFTDKVARQNNLFAQGVIKFVEMFIDSSKQTMTPYVNFFDAVSKSTPTGETTNEMFENAQSEIDVLAVAWKTVGNARASFSRQGMLSRLVASEQLNAEEVLEQPQTENDNGNFLVKRNTFLLRQKAKSVTETEQKEQKEGIKDYFNNVNNSLLLQTLTKLLKLNGYGDVFDNNGFIDTDKVFVLGMPRVNEMWFNSPTSNVYLNWRSLLNEASFSTGFLFDLGIWASPKVNNYAYLALPSIEINRSVSSILEDWWDFWVYDENSLIKLTYKQMISRFASEGKNVLGEYCLRNLLISEHLKMWAKMFWNLDYRDWVWVDKLSDERDENLLFASNAFSRVFVLPWSKDYAKNSKLVINEELENVVLKEFDILSEESNKFWLSQELSSEVTIGELDVNLSPLSFSGMSTFVLGGSNE